MLQNIKDAQIGGALNEKRLRAWRAATLLLFCATAILSIGFHHHDEHFQILEFAHWKVFGVHEWALPWEFKARVRPSVQPWIAVGAAKALRAMGLYDPFVWAAVLRTGMAVLWWWILWRMIRVFGLALSTDGRRLWIVAAFAAWWVPYIVVRFSAESFASALFLLAVTLLYEARIGANKLRRWWAVLAAGLLIGVSVSARPQMAFAAVGLGIWMLRARRPLLEYVAVAVAAAAGVALCYAADCAFYGERVFTAYNYWDYNIVKGIAASFGVEPWWWYAKATLLFAVPPISIVLLFLAMRGLQRKPWHPLALIFIAFVVGHSITGHKEMRFMFPVSALFIFLATAGTEGWAALRKPAVRKIAIGLAVMNGLLLLYRSAAPAQDAVAYYRYIYRHAHSYDSTLHFVGENPFTRLSLPVIVYRRLDVREVELKDYSSIDSALQASSSGRILFLDPYPGAAPQLAAYRPRRLYSLLPAWVQRLDFNGWVGRSKFWTIYQIERKTRHE